MWSQTNECFLDRRGCGDEFFIDADLRASSYLASLDDSDLLDDVEMLDGADDSAGN